jgi:hypothetical protein
MAILRTNIFFSAAFFGALFFLATASPAVAHVPNMVTQETLKDIVLIEDPGLSQAFYGDMAGFPHTFEIRAEDPFLLFVRILIPDISSSKDNISGIVIKENPEGGRVEEVARLSLKSAWPSEYELFGGDTYRMGPIFEGEVGSGVYRIEVSTPDNHEKYVLVVGKREEMTIGYFELLGRLADIKAFFGKSKFRVVESPYVYVPILAILLLGYILYRRRLGRG